MNKFNEDRVTVEIRLSPASDPIEATFEDGRWVSDDDDALAVLLNDIAPGFGGPSSGFSFALTALRELGAEFADTDTTIEVTGQPSQKWVNQQDAVDDPGVNY